MASLIDRVFDARYSLQARASISYVRPQILTPGELEATASIEGGWAKGFVVSGLMIAVAEISSNLYIDQQRTNWIAWSKIGSIDFTLDRTNDAGARPVTWAGWVHQVRPLGKHIVAYGSNGIALLSPVAEPAPTFAYKELYPVGLLDRNLVAGIDQRHYFIDANGTLCSLDAQGVKPIGYHEYLKSIHQEGTIPTMHFERRTQRLFICNGLTGFIYTKDGLGWGPSNITGLIQRDGELTFLSSGSVVYAPVNLVTNITNCGTNDYKPLQLLTISVYCPEDFYFQIDYRTSVKQDFKQTTWKRFNSRGEGFVNVTGIEFRVRVKTLVPVFTQIDDLVLHLRTPGVVGEREKLK